MLPINRVNASATAPPSSTPPSMSANPRDITSRSTFDAPAPSAMRNPSSRELCDTAYDITPYNPIAASSSANPRDITSRSTFDAPAPSAMRNPSSRELCDTAYDITPYNPIAASSSANPP